MLKKFKIGNENVGIMRIEMKDLSTTINFGIHQGKQLSDPSVPLSYIRWIAKRGSYQEPGNRFETKWKVPIVLMVMARREWEIRTGNRWSGGGA